MEKPPKVIASDVGPSSKRYIQNPPKVITGDDARAAPISAIPSLRSPSQDRSRKTLIIVWLGIVAVPWLLQVRGFLSIAVRHKLAPNLIPPTGASRIKTPAEVNSRCPARSLIISHMYFGMHPTHFYEVDGGSTESTLCHFVIPQYNSHGMYSIQTHKITAPSSTGLRSCANDSYAFNFYYYHGSIGYFALYDEGEGSYCNHDDAAYAVTTAVGSKDINFSALAKYEGKPGYHWSWFYCGSGTLWLGYRILVVSRSFKSCARFGRRLDLLCERMPVSSAIIYVQQAARLAAHDATNWQRFGLLYLLLEGIMTDLVMLIAFDGYSAKIQFVSLGYNIAGLLTMIFEIVENTKLFKPWVLVLVKRVLFNTEVTLWGELLLSILLQQYFNAMNHSDLNPSLQVAEAVSYYLWSLMSHGIFVVGLAACILTIRVAGTLAVVMRRFKSLRVLITPCCVDSIMGSRYKLATLLGYEFHNSRLYYSMSALKAHGLLKGIDDEGKELLVYHKIRWLPSSSEDLEVVGKLTGEHVDAYPERLHTGSVTVCDRKLGGVEEFHDDIDELESARLMTNEIFD